MTTDGTTDDTDVGGALSRLGDSMADLHTSSTGLGDAVEQLRASTQRLSEQQAAVSEQMAETVRTLDRGPSEAATTFVSASSAPSDVAGD